MENVADALKIAGWVLIFVVALSISINAFSIAREASDTILSYSDREYYMTDDDYLEASTDGIDTDGNGVIDSYVRKVGFESIIPSIYRAYKENYKIIFDFGDDTGIYSKNGESINYIDLENESIGDDTYKEELLKCILMGENNIKQQTIDKFYIKNDEITNYGTFKKRGYVFLTDGLYNKIKGSTFSESLGVYYQDEVGVEDSSAIPDSNKTKKRVITYTKQ